MTTSPPAATRLLWLPLDPTRPATCLHVDGNGRILARAHATADSPLATSGPPLHLVFPGTETRASWMPLEARSHAQAIAEVRVRLAPQLAGTDEDLHIAVAPAEAPGAARLVVLIERTRLQGWLERARALGATPVTATPDHLMLPTDADAATVLDFGSHWAVRAGTLAFSAEPALAGRILGGRSTWQLQADEEIDALLAAATPAIDLLGDGPAPRDTRAPGRRRRRTAWLAAALALSPVLLTGAQALRDTVAAHLLHAQAAERAAGLLQLPDPPADPAARIAEELASLQAPERLAGTAGALFDAMAQFEGAYLASLRYEGGRLLAEVVHPDPRHGDALLATLGEAGIGARLLDSRPVADGMRSQLQLEGRP